jgi:molybdate transport system substrate-binding protein
VSRRRANIAATLAALLAGALLLTGCGHPASRSGGVNRTAVVFAAASLTESFTTIAHRFEAKHPGVHVKLNFAGSDTLAASINAGAPVDVFAAASPKTLALVTTARHGSGQPVTFARNRLAIAVPPGNPKHIASLADTLRSGTKLVLCANAVPCGSAARKAYALAGLKPKPVSEELDVKAVLTKVELGEADAGLVYVSDVHAAGAKAAGVDFPESAKVLSSYPIVGVNTGKDPADGKAFLAYVLSPAGRDVLTGDGFLKP